MSDLNSLRYALVEIEMDPDLEARHLPLSLFEDITDNFSDERLIGTGGFGQVYKGLLPNGIVVAVKRLDPSAMVDDKSASSFAAELKCMRRLQHENIVRLLGYCIEEKIPERLLCMEFVPHGPLQIAGPSSGSAWPVCYQIIKGICSGLVHIHEKQYIHLDLKPCNILVGDNNVPKIIDFGISLSCKEKTKAKIPGTDGYRAPELTKGGEISCQADIYSLGAIIFELLTGTKGLEVHEKKEEDRARLQEVAFERWNTKTSWPVSPLVHIARQQVETCLGIAYNCKQEDPCDRRTAKEISHIIDLCLDPYIFDAQNVKTPIYVKRCTTSVLDLDFHPTEPWVVVSLFSGDIEIFHYQSKKLLEKINLSKKPVYSVKFVDEDGWNIVAGDYFGNLHVHNFDGQAKTTRKGGGPGVIKKIEATRGDAIKYMSFQTETRYLLLSTGNNIYIYNTADWTCIAMHIGPNFFKPVTHASFNTNHINQFIIGCCDGTVKLWKHVARTYNWYLDDIFTGRPHFAMYSHLTEVRSIDYFTHNSATFLVTGSMDMTAKVWRYDDSKHTYFTQDIQEITCETITEPEATLLHESGVTTVCCIPKFRIILTGTSDGVVSVWCAQTYRLKRYLCFGLGGILKLSYSLEKSLCKVSIGHKHGWAVMYVDQRQLRMKG